MLNSGSEEESGRGDRESSTGVSKGQADAYSRCQEGMVSGQQGGGVGTGAYGKEFLMDMGSDEVNLFYLKGRTSRA